MDSDLYAFELTGRDIVVGRSPSCDISLADDPLASRRHAVLSCTEGSYTITDLGSSNGTYLNGVEVKDETQLHDGDVISIGRYAIVVSSAPTGSFAAASGTLVTGPLPLLPPEDTDPHLAALGSDAARGATPVLPPMPNADARPDATPELETSAERAGPSESPGGDVELANVPLPLPTVAPQQHDLDALQIQLAALLDRLRQQAAADAAQHERLRRALSDVQDTLAMALATQLEPAADLFSARVELLADLARKTADNPRHLDYALGLSEHAEELVRVLTAVQKMRTHGGTLALLQGLLSRVQRELA